MRFIKKFFSKDLNKAFVRSFEKGFYQKALHYAQKGANPNAKNYEGNTFLHYYVAAYVHMPARELKAFHLLPEPDENILAQMKELGADMDCLNRYKQTPLDMALERDAPFMVSVLIRAGADKERRNKEGLTPLQNAVYHGMGRCMRILVRMGADIEAKLTTASSLTHLAEKGKAVFGKFSHTNFERVDMILQELKEKGFNVDKTPKPKEITGLAIIEPALDIQVIKNLQNQNTRS